MPVAAVGPTALRLTRPRAFTRLRQSGAPLAAISEMLGRSDGASGVTPRLSRCRRRLGRRASERHAVGCSRKFGGMGFMPGGLTGRFWMLLLALDPRSRKRRTLNACKRLLPAKSSLKGRHKLRALPKEAESCDQRVRLKPYAGMFRGNTVGCGRTLAPATFRCSRL